jgi:methylated-DNA-protein-cysteine methyltransferase-like protein
MAPKSSFSERVEDIVRQIPKGRLMTYGQIAALCGNARAARIVGSIAHFGNPEMGAWPVDTQVVEEDIGKFLRPRVLGF